MRRASSRNMLLSIVLAIALPLTGAASAQQQVSSARVAPGTPIKLMVTKEVDSRTAHAGDRFRLRVNEPVIVDGVTAIPVGTTAWGEITFVNGTSVVAGKGQLAAKLLYVDLPGGPLPITGTETTQGKSNGAGVAIAVFSFGLAGLLMKGGNAHFKAGDILTGYADTASDANLHLATPAAAETK